MINTVSNCIYPKDNPYNNLNSAELKNREESLFVNDSAKEEFDYSIDDGKISFNDKAKSFLKGVISPVTNLFKSPKNFIIGVGAIAGTTALTIATGGAIAPILVSLGVIGGGIQLGIGAYKASKAKSDDEAKNAWQNIGSGTSVLALSLVGAKKAASAGNIKGAEEMNAIEASIACVKNTPSSLKNSYNVFKSGEFLNNLCLNKASLKSSDECVNSNVSSEKVSDIKNIPEISDDMPEGVPDYLYHMTTKDNYNKILESGKLKISDWESGENGCHGIYMVDKNNLIHNWMGCKEQELFGDMDIGELLLTYTGAQSDSGMVAIEIPTTKLDASKLVFRPYVEACKLGIEGLDDFGIQQNELVTSGWKLSELAKYMGQEAIEFVYKEEIPTSSFSGIKSSQGNIPYSDIIRNLYG